MIKMSALQAQRWDMIKPLHDQQLSCHAIKKQILELHGELLSVTAITRLLKKHGLKAHGRQFGISKDLIKTLEGTGTDPSKVSHYWDKSDKRFSIFVKNKEVLTYDDVRDEFIQEMKKHSPKYKAVRRKALKDPHLFLIDPADIHINKLALAEETGEDYNIKKAIDQVHEGVDQLLTRAQGYQLEKIALVIGNDVLHSDDTKARTTSGTQLDVDSTWWFAYRAARKMYVQIIDSLINICDVQVIFNPSNHDYQSGWFLCDSLASWYKDCKNVSFDDSIKHRKYFLYGRNLIGTSHGDGAKTAWTPQLMAQEAAGLWSAGQFRYLYLHHLHHKIREKYLSSKDYIGVTVEFLRSPSAADGWHHRKGYVGAPKAIEGFMHSKEKGQVARFSHYF